MSTPQAQVTVNKGIVKLIQSGDTVVVRGQPRGGPPPEKTISFSNVAAPKLGRRATANSAETQDEPWAWEAREFLRKKLIGKEILFTLDGQGPLGRDYGVCYLGKDIAEAENLTKSMLSEGLVSLRSEKMVSDPELQELQEAAKVAKKGMWSEDPKEDHIREVKYVLDNPRGFVSKMKSEPVAGIVEHVRDASTIRVLLTTDNHHYFHITLMISGIRGPMFMQGDNDTPQPHAEEAKYFTESRLLQKDVEIILESVNNANFVGSVRHPAGNIAEALLLEGFARCVDWSISLVTGGPEKLLQAEKYAKEKKLKLFKDYTPPVLKLSDKDKEFTGRVVEIVNADALVVKRNDGTAKKVFLASLRPPRIQEQDENKVKEMRNSARGFRPLYDIPHMFEAREFLRKKVIGKKVSVTVDYIQPENKELNFPARECCTIKMGDINIAEAMVSKGYATVVRYRQDDDSRSSCYYELLAAEGKAEKSGKGLHSKKPPAPHRVQDITGDANKAKQFLPFLQRAGKLDAVVEFVASGSRLRLYVPRETCLFTFLLAGISCPRAARPVPGGAGGLIPGEPFGEEALAFTKDLVMQREIEIEVESMDKAGNFIGYMHVDGKNLSVCLVEEGLASMHFTAERSVHYSRIKNAEDQAKKTKKAMWEKYDPSLEKGDDEGENKENEPSERVVQETSIVITEITPDLKFYAQRVEQGQQLEELMNNLRQEFKTSPPVTGAYTPKRGDTCAAKFAMDNEWYRAKVERVSGGKINVLYIDYGNRETVQATQVAALPQAFQTHKPFAKEYGVACVQAPKDAELMQETVRAFSEDTINKTCLINTEYRVGGLEFVSVLLQDTKDDVIKGLVSDGLLHAEKRKEKRLQKLVKSYWNAQESAKKAHLNLWQYGDVTEEEQPEWGMPGAR